MSREIIEAVREIEREKGIGENTLVHALEDALLAAYKKTPGAARHAQVELDDEGDFRVWSVELPADIEERLIEEARERAITELEEAEAANGERSHTLITDDDLDIDDCRLLLTDTLCIFDHVRHKIKVLANATPTEQL